MPTTLNTFGFSTFLLLIVLATGLTERAVLAQSAAEQRGEQQLMMVTGEAVFVRTGPGTTYYPFGKVNTNDVVTVVGEKNGWSRVLTNGRPFATMRGYIRLPEGDTSRFRLDEGGAKGTTLGRVELIAPNINLNGDPIKSWKRLRVLPANTNLQVLSTQTVEGMVIHTVNLPTGTEGWIRSTLLRAAPPELIANQQNAAAGKANETPKSSNASPNNSNQSEKTNRDADPIAGTPATETAQPGTEKTNPAAANPKTDEVPKNEEPKAVLATEERALNGDGTTEVADPAIKEPVDVLDDLEDAYQKLRQEPIESAEVEPLRALYLDLAGSSDTPSGVSRYANARAEQLAIWARLQQQRLELAILEQRLKQNIEDAEAERRAIALVGDYAAVGRLATSTIFNGEGLPQLYRLQDAGSGRTIAYIQPTDQWDLPGLLGQIVGVIGKRQYDDGLRLNLIRPERFDLLGRQ